MRKLAERIVHYRWLVLLFFFAVTLIFTTQIPRVIIDTDLKSQLPKDMPSRLDTDKIDELFGGTEMLLVIVRTDDVLQPETLVRVRSMAKKINRVDGVDKVLSLFDLKSIKSEDGMMIVEPAVPDIPRTDSDREALRQELRENDLVYGSVVSEDFKLTAIIAMLETDIRDEDIIPAFQTIIDESSGDEEVRIGGLPVSRLEMGEFIERDMRLLLPVGIFIMLVFLFACFRRIRGVVLPFLVVIMSILVSIGFIVVIGWKIHMVTVILPIMLVAIANDYGIHLIAKYQEDNLPSNNYTNKELASRMFVSLGRPVLLTGLTTIAGMLCLLGHILIPAQQLGVLAAFGIFFALFASLFLIPAIISFLPRSRPVLVHADQDKKKPPLERLLWFFGSIVSEKPKGVIVTAILLAAISLIGVFQVVVDTNPNGYYQKDHPTVETNNLIDKYLGGSQNVSIVYKGDIKNPEMVRKIEAMECKLAAMDEVGTTTSIAKVLRQMSRALNDPGDPMYNKLPETRNGVAQYFELYSMSGDPEDFSKMVDFPYEHAILTARINKTSTITLEKVVERIQEMTQDDPDVLLVGGFGVVLSDLAKAVVNGQVLSLLLATGVVALLLSILFRSLVAGLIGAIPLALSILVLFGLMGVFHIELNIATAMLSSIMIGVGVDYTIHFLWRYREERANRLEYAAAVKKTLTTTGRGIIFNAFSVIVGFTALLFSSFLPVQFFGFLVVISILACLIGALVLVPALCIVFRPKFLEPKSVAAVP
ncbi:RND family transporter [candidate division KSB1 bacterium]|nr:RND family transporter [candidate division KSB1 bacterium]